MTATLIEAYERRLAAFHEPTVEEFYSPTQPRAKDGKWTKGPTTGKMWSGVSAHPKHRVAPISKVTFPIEQDTYETPREARHRFAQGIYDADLGGGYTSRVSRAASDIVEWPSGDPTNLSVRGEILLNGRKVGVFERSLTMEKGKLVAGHDGLYINPSHQGSGIADRFNTHAVAEYQRMGVDRIVTNAGETVGGYAWARQGFRYVGPDQSRRDFLSVALNRMTSAIKYKAVLRPHAAQLKKEIAALQKAIDAGEDVQPIHIASLGEKYARHTARDDHGNVYTTWPGKSALLGTNWLGAYYFDANNAVTAAASSLEHARLRPAFINDTDVAAEVLACHELKHTHTSGGIEFACRDASCRPPTSGGTGGSLPSAHVAVSDIRFHSEAYKGDYLEATVGRAGIVKHLGSLRVAGEMTDRERTDIEKDLDYEATWTPSGSPSTTKLAPSDKPLAHAVYMANANVANVPRTTVGISVQLVGIYNRYADDYKKMDKVTEALTRYEGTYEKDLRGSRAKLSVELERITGVSVASGFVSYVHEQWAHSAHSPESTAMQLVAAGQHKLTAAKTSLVRHMGTGRDLVTAKALVKKVPKALVALSDATYRLTQRELARHGITEVEVYRGVSKKGTAADKIIAQPSPLSSWSTSQTEAFNFSLHGSIYKATIPASRVYSLSNLSGTGSLSEREVLVLGHPTVATVHELQIPHSEAQNFNDFAHEDLPVVEIDAEDFDWIKKRKSVLASAYARHVEEFYNKNHDPKDGKFTSGRSSIRQGWEDDYRAKGWQFEPSARNVTRMTRTEQAALEKAEFLKRHPKANAEKYDEIYGADFHDDGAITYRTHTKQGIRIDVIDRTGEGHPDRLDEITRFTADMVEQFPHPHYNDVSVTVSRDVMTEGGEAAVTGGTAVYNGITIAPAAVNNTFEFRNLSPAAVRSNITGKTAEYVIAHEYGHSLDYDVTRANGIGRRSDTLTINSTATQYAKTNKREYWAEAFADNWMSHLQKEKVSKWVTEAITAGNAAGGKYEPPPPSSFSASGLEIALTLHELEHTHTSGGIEFACHSKACAPPPVGKGGSLPSGSARQKELLAGKAVPDDYNDIARRINRDVPSAEIRIRVPVDVLDSIFYSKPAPFDVQSDENGQSVFDAYTTSQGIPVGYGGNSAFYSPHQDKIQLPHIGAFTGTEEFYSTAFHEAAHSTGHTSRLNRAELNDMQAFGDHAYSREELVAELASALVLGTLGLDKPNVVENQAAYLKGWQSKIASDPQAFVWAAGRAEKAADMILGVVPEIVTEGVS